MYELSADNVAEYLRSSGRAGHTEPIEASELTGGVSNAVLRVSLPRRDETFVIKQARTRLRVKDEWLCSAERIWHEVAALRYCSETVEAGSQDRFRTVVPQILWEDCANFTYAMTAAPQEHKTWKELLLAGEVECSLTIAVACGSLLARLHARSWTARARETLAEILFSPAYFAQLRIDPYYQHVERHHPELAPAINRLIDSIWENRCCFVHGDFSPKNLLVWPGHVMLIDFEVGHYGDPAFDLGFFLTHLMLKSVWAGERGGEYRQIADLFWQAYRAAMLRSVDAEEVAALEQRMLLNLAGCMLARVDGKSPVDYLGPRQQEIVRSLSRNWLLIPPPSWKAAIANLE